MRTHEPKSISPDKVAARFMDRARIHGAFDPRLDLCYVRSEDALFLFEDGVWRILDQDMEFPRVLSSFIAAERDPDAPRDKGGILPLHPDHQISPQSLETLASMVKMSLPPSAVLERLDSDWMTFSDGNALNLSTHEVAPATRAMRSFFKVPFPSTVLSDPSVECPRFDAFLRSVLVRSPSDATPNESLIAYVQEVFGYCLMDTVRLHVCFFFHGSGQNGKSVLLSVLRALFPPSLVSSVKVADVSRNNFAASALVGKKLNLVNEEEARAMRTDVFKNLVGGDTMSVDRKFREPVTFVPRCKFVWATNDIPAFEKLDDAMRRRIRIVPFYRRIPDDERDPDILDALLLELPGILKWSLEGARRLRANGWKFTAAQDVADAEKAMGYERFPAFRYFDEFYEVTGLPSDYVFNKGMYDDYVAWCRDNGHRPLSENKFGAQVVAFDPSRITGGNERESMGGLRARVRRGFRRRKDAPPFAAPSPSDSKSYAYPSFGGPDDSERLPF